MDEEKEGRYGDEAEQDVSGRNLAKFLEALEEPGDIKKRSSDVEALEHEDGSVAHMGDDKGAVSCKRQEHENKPQERQFKKRLAATLGVVLPVGNLALSIKTDA